MRSACVSALPLAFRLEDKVWIVVPLKNDTDQDQLAYDNLFELLQNGNLRRADLPLEKSVGSRNLVVGEPNLSSHDGQE